MSHPRPVGVNRTALLMTAMVCATAAVIAHWTANAGPLDPPSNAYDSPGVPRETGPSLADIDAELQSLNVSRNSAAGFISAGLPVGAMDTQYGSIISEQSGIIRKIIVNDVADGYGDHAVELQIDGTRYGGLYRSHTGNGTAGNYHPAYEVDIVFSSGVQARAFANPGSQSIAILYEPTTP